MADLTDIRRGLAANLRTSLPESEGHVSAWMRDSPGGVALQVVGLDEFEYDTFGFGRGSDQPETLAFIVEAVIPRQTDIGSQMVLDRLLSGITSVKVAIEDDPTLTKRLLDNGLITENNDPAATWAQVKRYRGQSNVTLPDGTTALLASWAVEVAA